MERTHCQLRSRLTDRLSRYDTDSKTFLNRFAENLAFPITVSGRLRSNIRTTLGDGGPLVRVKTTNGGVKVRQRGSVVR